MRRSWRRERAEGPRRPLTPLHFVLLVGRDHTISPGIGRAQDHEARLVLVFIQVGFIRLIKLARDDFTSTCTANSCTAGIGQLQAIEAGFLGGFEDGLILVAVDLEGVAGCLQGDFVAHGVGEIGRERVLGKQRMRLPGQAMPDQLVMGQTMLDQLGSANLNSHGVKKVARPAKRFTITFDPPLDPLS